MADRNSMSRTLVIGATGNIGREVVCQLAVRGRPVRGLTRDPDNAHLPPEIEVARGDLTAPARLIDLSTMSNRYSWCGQRRRPRWTLLWN